MNKITWRILLTILIGTSLSTCKPIAPAVPTRTSTVTVAVNIATSTTEALAPAIIPTPTPRPTLSPTPGPLTTSPGWTTYPDIQSIKDMLIDPDGNLWAVGPQGAFVLKPDGTIQHFTIQDGLPSNDLLSVGEDTGNAVWVGSNGSGVSRFDGKGWQTFTSKDGLGGDVVLDIIRYTDHRGILVGTNHGLSEYDTEKWQNYSGLSYLPDDEVRTITIPDYSDMTWVGTAHGMRLFGTSQIYTTNNGLVANEVNDIAPGLDCSLWVGTDAGVSHFGAEHWTSYTSADGLADNRITAAAVTLNGSVWFGTQSGVSRFDGNSWTTYTTQDGLADNNVLSILVAPDDTLWIGTAGGLSHYSPALDLRGIETGQFIHAADGLQVVYIKEGDLWKWSEGVKWQITRDGDITGFLLSPDLSKIAIFRQGGYYSTEIWVINQDGSGERLLVNQDDLSTLGKTSETDEIRQKETYVLLRGTMWVPGTTMLAFGTERYIRYDGTIFHDDLDLVNAETSEKTTLLPPGLGGGFTYSPDGSQIAIIGQNQISIVNADGSSRRDKLLEYPTIHDIDYPFYPKPIWSADGQYLLLALPPEDPMEWPTAPTTLWRIPADGSTAIRLGSINPSDSYAFSVYYSPDLTRLAYWSLTDNRSEIHVANFDGTDNKVVQTGNLAYFVSWATDGQHFAYYTHPDPDGWYISDLVGNSTALPYKPETLRWVDHETFLHTNSLGCAYELRLTSLNGDSQLIDRFWPLPWSYGFFYK